MTTHKHKVPHHRSGSFLTKLEVYAFWTGFASTLISLVQVIVIALRG